MGNNILLDLAIIILLSKIFGAISLKLKQPPVTGILLLGIILGPTVLHLLDRNDIFDWIAQLGMLFLLFESGLETDLKMIKEDTKHAFLTAVAGIILPLLLAAVYIFFLTDNLIQGLIVGIISTATSVSVSVMTLMDMGKLKSIEGRCIVNAAIMDDILGILLLTVIFGIATGGTTSSGAVVLSIAKIVVFFLIAILFGLFVIKPLFLNLKKLLLENAVIAMALTIILLYAWFAEITGLAAITGAYFAGLFLGQTSYKNTIRDGISNLGKSFFVDVFFVNIGLGCNLLAVKVDPVFLIIFVVSAVLGKIFGCGIGARLTHFDWTRSLRIGIGMIPRGEVALVIANMVMEQGLVSSEILSATIIMVIISALITPSMLQFSFAKIGRKGF
ncbi:MAG TPA: cation:proton antiporter [Candidatus Cloacimonadota bacterium]|nr:cation:proton antiporter [Candidatus Cloacimonadota bacterium]